MGLVEWQNITVWTRAVAGESAGSSILDCQPGITTPVDQVARIRENVPRILACRFAGNLQPERFAVDPGGTSRVKFIY